MGLLDKIEQNLEHGGIKVSINAAQSLSHQDETLTLTVTVINSQEIAHTIKGIIAEIQSTEDASGISMALNNTVQLKNTTDNNEMYNMQTITIAQVKNAEAFTLQPNESKTITLDILVDNKIKQDGYKYTINVSVEVDDIKLNPHAHQNLQIV